MVKYKAKFPRVEAETILSRQHDLTEAAGKVLAERKKHVKPTALNMELMKATLLLWCLRGNCGQEINMAYPLFPTTGMAYYKGKMMERTEIVRLKLSEDPEPTKIPEKW